MLDLRITVTRGDGRATVRGRVLRDGVEVPISWPVIIVNPPEMVPDGEGGYRHDPDEAIRQVVIQLAEGL